MDSAAERAHGERCLADAAKPLERAAVPTTWRRRGGGGRGRRCCRASHPPLLLVVYASSSSKRAQALVRRSAGGLAEQAIRLPGKTNNRRPHHAAKIAFHVLAYDNGADIWEGGSPQRLVPSPNMSSSGAAAASWMHISNAGLGASMVVPKMALLATNLHRLRRTHARAFSHGGAVWLPDADVDFTHFDAPHYFLRWRCAFPGGPPLISQPTIRTPNGARTQLWWPVDAGEWEAPNGTFAQNATSQK